MYVFLENLPVGIDKIHNAISSNRTISDEREKTKNAGNAPSGSHASASRYGARPEVLGRPGRTFGINETGNHTLPRVKTMKWR